MNYKLPSRASELLISPLLPLQHENAQTKIHTSLQDLEFPLNPSSMGFMM